MGKILSSLILGKTIPTKITNNQKILYCLTQEWTNKTIEDNFGEILPVNKISNLRGGDGQKVYLMSHLGTKSVPIIKTSTYYTFLET